jgi:hypothetical protein
MAFSPGIRCIFCLQSTERYQHLHNPAQTGQFVSRVTGSEVDPSRGWGTQQAPGSASSGPDVPSSSYRPATRPRLGLLLSLRPLLRPGHGLSPSPASSTPPATSPRCWLCRPTEASEQCVELNDLGFVHYDVGRRTFILSRN